MQTFEKTPSYVGKKTDVQSQTNRNAYAQMAQQPVRRYPAGKLPYDKKRGTYTNPGRYNLQDQFLAALCDNGVECDLMLRNEANLRGKVVDYDNWSLLIDKDDKSYLIFKSGIMALIPLDDVKYNSADSNRYGREIAEAHGDYNYGYS